MDESPVTSCGVVLAGGDSFLEHALGLMRGLPLQYQYTGAVRAGIHTFSFLIQAKHL
ncbi:MULTISPECIES: hypothetical protein [unclassified Microbulbifer]|uniref:hypothetical protein n=1 Tax=unclassified Microbulbifer TaxID=2619833 RepID=UPI0027E56AB4|nr:MULTISPECIES: hypothetical protein [unclassified Microbulbifer]